MRIRPHKATLAKSKSILGMQPVPVQFRPIQNFRYPIDNYHAFERWYHDTYTERDARARIYLPIQWTAYYCNHRFGEDKRAVKELQNFIDTLPATEQYYTIVQFDHGILNDVSRLDLRIIGMAGGHIDYPIPLLCMPHATIRPQPRDIFASFVGSDNHPIRSRMIQQLKQHPDYYISTRPHTITEYCTIMARSKYVLCPRGVGKTSFRIQEAIQQGAVPVYISDEHILPYNEPFRAGILVQPHEDIDGILRSTRPEPISPTHPDYTYKGCKQNILQYLQICE